MEIRVPVPVEIDACAVDTPPLPEPPVRSVCPPKPEAWVGDWKQLEACYDPGNAWRLDELIRILGDVYLDALACEK